MFITFEGGEGAGKSTQIVKVVHYLRSLGIPCLATREPGGTEIGGQIRKILRLSNNKELVPEAELLLFLADRVQHVRQLINPALNEGLVVLCDRYIDSTYAYQGVARNLSFDLMELHWMLEIPDPDVTLLLDLSPECGLSRANSQAKNGGRDKTQERFEEEALSFHRDLRRGYLSLAEKEPNRFCIINAEENERNVFQQIKKVLDVFF